VIETPDDLGTLYAIELKFEECLKRAKDLHLLKIEICDEEISYEFPYDNFISVQNIDERFKKIILLEKCAEFL
jgi:hypothetical protein